MDTVEEMTLRDFKKLLDFPEDRFDPRDHDYLWIKSKISIRPVYDGSKWQICYKFKKERGVIMRSCLGTLFLLCTPPLGWFVLGYLWVKGDR